MQSQSVFMVAKVTLVDTIKILGITDTYWQSPFTKYCLPPTEKISSFIGLFPKLDIYKLFHSYQAPSLFQTTTI